MTILNLFNNNSGLGGLGSTTNEIDIGYDRIRVCRPKFIYFEFTGLRPNVPHWIFFDGVEVTKWVNTSFSHSAFLNADRGSPLRNPGDLYTNATAFPEDHGGPTAPSGPINTDSTGSISGLFYIQSNGSLSFPTGRRALAALDISAYSPNDSLSFAKGSFESVGQYQLYYVEEINNPPPPDGYNPGDWLGGEGGYDCGCDGDPDHPDQCNSYGNEGGGGDGGGGDGCFTKDTLVTMADGTTKKISEVAVGEFVRGYNNTLNKVTFIEKPSTSASPMLKNVYAPNGEKPFATMNHPLWIDGQLSAVNPRFVGALYPWILKISKIEPLQSYTTTKVEDDYVYNLFVDGDGTYIVNGYGTHSINGDGGFVVNAFNQGLLDSREVVDTLYAVVNNIAVTEASPSTPFIYGAYKLNVALGKINNKYINRAMAHIIKTRILYNNDPNDIMRVVLRNVLSVWGTTQLWLDGVKLHVNKPTAKTPSKV